MTFFFKNSSPISSQITKTIQRIDFMIFFLAGGGEIFLKISY